jgi:hypothetical protein
MTVNALIAATAALQRLDGVAGILLFKGENIVHRQMPFAHERTVELRRVVGRMLAGYQQVNRLIQQIYLDFEGGGLLLMVQGQSVLALVLTGRADPDLVTSVGGALLREHAPLLAELGTAESELPVEHEVEELVVTSPRRMQEMAKSAEVVAANWMLLRKQVEMILSRVMGSAQVTRLIDRTLEEQQVGDPYRLSAGQARQLAVAIIEHIPNTGKRRQLLAELERQLVTINL